MHYFLLYVFLFANGTVGYYEETLPPSYQHTSSEAICERVRASKEREISVKTLDPSGRILRDVKLYCRKSGS